MDFIRTKTFYASRDTIRKVKDLYLENIKNSYKSIT